VRDIAALPHVISIISRSRADAGGTEGNEMEFEALLLTLWRLYDRSRRISGEAPRDFHAELEIYARPWNPEPIGVEKGWSHA
jgi:hypothetical protein